MSFGGRVALALGFLALVSAIELAIRGRGPATRWRGSLLLIASGTAGALFGALHDLVTVQVGPAYCAIGKGLGDGPGLIGRAVALGGQAGAGAGVVAGAVLLVAAGAEVRFARFARHAARVAVAAGLGAALGLAVGAALPGAWATAAGFGVAPADREGFVAAWGGHFGSYAGALAGLGGAALRLRRAVRGAGGPGGPSSGVERGIAVEAPRASTSDR